MTDQERRRRRLEMERRMRSRQTGRRPERYAQKNLLLFRTYVTVILAGAFLLVSVFHTETSELVSTRLKETIAYQMPLTEVAEAKEWLAAFWQEQEFSLPVFEPEEKPVKTYKPDLEDSP